MSSIEIVDIDGIGNPSADGCSATYAQIGDPDQGDETHSGEDWSESIRWSYTYYQLRATVGGGWEFDHWEWDFITEETHNGEDVPHDPDPNRSTTPITPRRGTSDSLREGDYYYEYTNESIEAHETISKKYSVKNIKAVFRLPKVECTIVARTFDEGCAVYPELQTIEVAKNTDFSFTIESIPAAGYKLERWTKSGVEVSREPILEQTLNSGEYGVYAVYYAFFKKDEGEGGTGIILREDKGAGIILRSSTRGIILRDKDPLVKQT